MRALSTSATVSSSGILSAGTRSGCLVGDAILRYFSSFLTGGWISTYRINARSHTRANCAAVTMRPTCRHVNEKLTTSVSRRVFKAMKASVVYTQFVTPQVRKPATTWGLLKPLYSLPGAGHGLDILTHNLMHALPTQFKLIRDLAQRLSAASKIKYQRVALNVRRWTRLERAPLPSRDSFKLFDPGLRKESLLPPLPHVPNPCAKIDLSSFDDFGMRSRNIAMSFARSELNECCFISVESGVVVHNAYNSGSNNYEV